MPRLPIPTVPLVTVLSLLLLCACSGGDATSRATRVDATPLPAVRVDAATCPPVTLSRTGERHVAVDAANDRGTWDLRGAVWEENSPDPIEYPIRSEAWTRGCVIGGTVHGDIPRGWTRDQWYDGEDGGTSFGGEAFRQTMTDTPDNFLVIKDAYVDDTEDAYDPNSPQPSNTTYLLHDRTGLVRDDCIENEDVPHAMVVKDSLFDGCFTAFAERPGSEHAARNGHGPFAFTVESSLVHVRPQRLGPGYCEGESVAEGRCTPTGSPDVWLGSYGIWKWSPEAASRVTVRDTIFRLDMPSYSSCASQEWPVGTYENVTLVWTGQGSYRNAGDCHNQLPHGVTLTTDLSVWRAARRAWLDGAGA